MTSSGNSPSAHETTAIAPINSPERAALIVLRLIAFAVDFALFAFPIIYAHKQWAAPANDIHALSLVALSFFFLLGVCESRFGSTPGKLLVHLRVVDAHGHYPSITRAILRRCIFIIDALFGGVVGAIALIFTKRAQRVGDILTGTYVIIKIRKWGSRGKNS